MSSHQPSLPSKENLNFPLMLKLQFIGIQIWTSSYYPQKLYAPKLQLITRWCTEDSLLLIIIFIWQEKSYLPITRGRKKTKKRVSKSALGAYCQTLWIYGRTGIPTFQNGKLFLSFPSVHSRRSIWVFYPPFSISDALAYSHRHLDNHSTKKPQTI